MFNTARFNLAQFNLGAPDVSEIQADAVFAERWASQTTMARAISRGAEMTEAVGADARLLAGVVRSAMFREALRCTGTLHRALFRDARLVENIHASTGMRKRIYAACVAATVTQGRVTSGRRIHAGAAMSETLGQRAAYGVHIRRIGLRFETYFDAQASNIRLEVAYITLALTLPPGKSVVIDASDYTVTLDGENAVHAHSGAWPVLSRNTYDIVVEGANAPQLARRIQYTERWK